MHTSSWIWKDWSAAVILLLVLGTTACGQTLPSATPVPSATRQLTPYWSPTPSQTLLVKSSQISTPSPPPLPTPTPITYTVIKGDTMLGIALRFGVSLEDLLAANPEVDPRFLSVGTNLIIPLKEEETLVIMSPTPPSVELKPPDCYRTADAGVWCFILVENSQPYALENISARISLYSVAGEEIVGETGITPLNLLPAGEAMPVAVFFWPPVPEDFSAFADRFTAFAVPKRDERYLSASVTVDQIEVDSTGLQAKIRGIVELPKKSTPANLLWLAGIAYDSAGHVVGLRKWEAPRSEGGDDPEYVLKNGDSLPFDVEVYSLGPEIRHVDVLAEARP